MKEFYGSEIYSFNMDFFLYVKYLVVIVIVILVPSAIFIL
jgi:hypothetical protein